jgi:hypothetical protein
MSTTIKGKYSRLVLNTDDIIKDIDRNEFLRRRAAGRHAVKVMRDNVSKKGKSISGGFPAKQTGKTRRTIGMVMLKIERAVLVGSKDWKAHLLEFGWGDGKSRTKRPFVFRSLVEAEPQVIAIMSKGYF